MTNNDVTCSEMEYLKKGLWDDHREEHIKRCRLEIELLQICIERLEREKNEKL